MQRTRRVQACMPQGGVGYGHCIICILQCSLVDYHYHALLFAQSDHLRVFPYVIDCLNTKKKKKKKVTGVSSLVIATRWHMRSDLLAG